MTLLHAIDGAAHEERRRAVRYLAAGLCVATALIYIAIGLGAISVVDEVSASAPPMLVFGAAAGATFLAGAVLLVATDQRVLWVVGALYQVAVIVMYLDVAPQRTPSFELWGVLIKILQVAILAALVYLAVRQPARAHR